MSSINEKLAGSASFTGPSLRAWQISALQAWHLNNKVGVIEAITGTGKTMVGVAAIHETVINGGQAIVLVPSRALLEQWSSKLKECLPQFKIGTYAAETRDNFQTKHVIVSTVQTFYADPIFPAGTALLVADEVHRYGSEAFSEALIDEYDQRLGLSGSFYRNDDGIEDYLLPYFQQKVYGYGYEQALKDGVVAPFHLGLVSCEFTSREHFDYTEAQKRCTDAQTKLVSEFHFSPEWKEFFNQVSDAIKADKRGAYVDRFKLDLCYNYMSAFSEKRKILAEADAKSDFVATIAPALEYLNGTLVFTETMESSEDLARRIVEAGVAALPIHSDHSHGIRATSLQRFAKGELDVLCAPRVLDEGVDIPEAELAIIVATSQTKRQLVQRMGRVIRLKADGRHARLLIMFVRGTSEDPANGGHEAFLDEITSVAETVNLFDSASPRDVAQWLIPSNQISR